MKKVISLLTVLALLFTYGTVLTMTASAGSTMSGATAISTNCMYRDNIASEENVDYFKFTLSYAGSVYLNFQHENLFNQNIFWDVLLLNNANQEIATFEFNGTDTNVNTYVVGLNAGTYYLRVTGDGWSDYWNECNNYSDKSYYLTVKYTQSAYWEKENNESFEKATPIFANTTIKGSVNDEEDQDFYRVTLSSAGNIYLNFVHGNLFDQNEYWDVALFNIKTDEIITFGISGAETTTNTMKIGLAAGTYYLRVTGDGWSDYWHECNKFSNKTYAFNVKYTKSAYWEKEINGEFSAATGIFLGKAYSGTIRNDKDMDYYKFNVNSATGFKFTIATPKQNTSDPYYQVKLYDSKNNELLKKDIAGNKKSTVFYKSLKRGTYYLRVAGGNYSDYWYDCDRYTTKTYAIKVEEKLGVTSKVSATATTGSIKLSWKGVTGAAGYVVYKYNPGTKKYVKVKTTKSTTYKAKGLKSATAYKFKIVAYKTKGGVRQYGDAKVYSTATKPGKTSISSIKKKSAGYYDYNITVKWKKVTRATGYELVVSTSKDFSYPTKKLTKKTSAKVGVSGFWVDKCYIKVRPYKTVGGKKIYGAYSKIKTVRI